VQVRREDVARLRAADPEERRAILLAESGLPGPRANLPLAHAAAEVLEPQEARRWARGDAEYLALCGAIALAAHADPEAVLAAKDPRWRVREGVAQGLQTLAARDPMGFSEVLDAWRDDPDPLVQRARAAAVCEPPLLKDLALAGLALEVCREATAALRAAGDRRSEGVRVLRQALGWCWSVAVAADPARGLEAFRMLEADPDPDVRWVERENRRKVRLQRLLDPSGAEA
jgi:hypothetical protein